jgi:hypothetical protein
MSAAVSFSQIVLEPGHLGGESGPMVPIYRDATGWGWYVDPTPADVAEFAASANISTLESAARPRNAWTC